MNKEVKEVFPEDYSYERNARLDRLKELSINLSANAD